MIADFIPTREVRRGLRVGIVLSTILSGLMVGDYVLDFAWHEWLLGGETRFEATYPAPILFSLTFFQWIGMVVGIAIVVVSGSLLTKVWWSIPVFAFGFVPGWVGFGSLVRWMGRDGEGPAIVWPAIVKYAIWAFTIGLLFAVVARYELRRGKKIVDLSQYDHLR